MNDLASQPREIGTMTTKTMTKSVDEKQNDEFERLGEGYKKVVVVQDDAKLESWVIPRKVRPSMDPKRVKGFTINIPMGTTAHTDLEHAGEKNSESRYGEKDAEQCSTEPGDKGFDESDNSRISPEAAQGVIAPKYAVGTRVKKYFEGHGWFSGQVISYDGEYFNVIYEDGDSEEYNDKEMENIVLSPDLAMVEVGSRVAVYWPKDDQYYDATVIRERNKRRPLYLEYDDGKCEWIDLRKHRFRLLPGGVRSRTEEVVDDEESDDDSESEASSDHELDDDDYGKEENESVDSESNYKETPDSQSQNVEVGSRIALYWPDDDVYYKATVIRERNKRRPFYLRYDDGVCEWINLCEHKFRLLPRRKSADNVESNHGSGTEPSEIHDDEKTIESTISSFRLNKSSKRCHVDQIVSNACEVLATTSDRPVEASKRRCIDRPPNSDPCKVSRLGIVSNKSEESGFQDKGVFQDSSDDEEFEFHFEKGSATFDRDNKGILTKSKVNADISCDNRAPEKSIKMQQKDLPRIWTGPKVKKFFDDDIGWLTGDVTRCEREYYEVTYEDGRVEKCSSQELSEILITPTLSKIEIGSRLAVYREVDGKCYEATVLRERNARMPWYLEYENGDCEWIDLRQHKFRLLPVPRRVSYSSQKLSHQLTGNPDLAKVQIGSRLDVYWEGDGKYYEATVSRELKSSAMPWYLEYDSGDCEWIDLRQHKFRLLQKGTSPCIADQIDDDDNWL